MKIHWPKKNSILKILSSEIHFYKFQTLTPNMWYYLPLEWQSKQE